LFFIFISNLDSHNISKNRKTEFKGIEIKLLEMRRNKYKVIEDPQLRDVLKKLI
jgi:hypothetical protein